MKAYLESLYEQSQEHWRQREQAAAMVPQTDPRILCDKPLTEQIEELMRSLPPVERQRRWTMAEFVSRLSGRYGANPHPMRVGEALRAMGWTQRRDWTTSGEGRRYWVTELQDTFA